MAQNSAGTAKKRVRKGGSAKPRGPGKPFTKGDPRINRGGRPKGMVALIREITEDGETLARRMNDLFEGRIKIPDVMVVDKKLVKVVKHASHKDIIRAAEWLRDTTWGRPMQAVQLTGKDGGPIQTSTSQDLSGYTDEELRTLRSVALARAQRERDRQGAGEAQPAGLRDVEEPPVQ